ncbi:MAG: MBL fold metallo-hydrolase [Pseudomonadota bacterium]
MRFAYLGSGSKGNACVIEAGRTRVLLDCGFSIKETVRRLARLALEPRDLTAIMVTHEHSDHIAGVGGLARRYDLPVYMTPGTHASNKAGELPVLHLVNSHSRFELGELAVQPVPVPHDAKEPCQYVFSHQGLRLGILTDVGHITPFIERHYARCDALVVECNHDREMLHTGPYPPRLKQRVGGQYGHLNNEQAATLLRTVDFRRLKMVMAVHISEKNNCVHRVRRALESVLPQPAPHVELADQNDGTPWWCLRTLAQSPPNSIELASPQVEHSC